MTHDEMIAVIQAHKEGKVIEINCGEGWMNMYNPNFNFMDYKYRIKIEPDSKAHYRPFKSAEEVMEAIKEHGDWITNGDSYFKLVCIFPEEIECGNDARRGEYTFESAWRNFAFADGTPFGKLED